MDNDSYDNGRRFLSPWTRNILFHKLTCDTLQIISGAALAAYTWKSNYHFALTGVFSTIGTAGAISFCISLRKHFQKIPNLHEEHERLWELTSGTILYSASVYTLSEALKRNEEAWIPCVGVAAFGYSLSVISMSRLEHRNPFLKCGQVMFGPVLTALSAYYLQCFQKHEDELLFRLPLLLSIVTANNISYFAYQRVENKDEPNSLLIKGIELLLSGCTIWVNGSILIVYTLNHDLEAVLTLFYVFNIFNGVTDIVNSLELFQQYTVLETRVFDSICLMILGPVMFMSACLGAKYIQKPLMFTFFFPAGFGLALLGKSFLDLFVLVTRRIFVRYVRRVLGPIIAVWGILATTYVGYHMGWRFSLTTMPLIPFGMVAAYQGFKNMDDFMA